MKSPKINPKTGKPINWQKPKEDHPWRQYANRKVKSIKEELEEEKLEIITVKEYLTDLLDNWDKIEVTLMTSSGGDRTYPLKGLSQRRIAAYITGVLKRNYVK